MKINKTNIGQVLRESAVDPRKNKGIKILIDVGNREYYINRVIELLAGIDAEMDETNVQARLQTAVTVLAVARLTDK